MSIATICLFFFTSVNSLTTNFSCNNTSFFVYILKSIFVYHMWCTRVSFINPKMMKVIHHCSISFFFEICIKQFVLQCTPQKPGEWIRPCVYEHTRWTLTLTVTVTLSLYKKLLSIHVQLHTGLLSTLSLYLSLSLSLFLLMI